MLILLPQITQILRFCLKKNLKIARARAWGLTVASRRKPAEFWSQTYIEEWAQPPVPPPSSYFGGVPKHSQPKWLQYILFKPSQFAIKHCTCLVAASAMSHLTPVILQPINPTFPLIFPVFIATVRSVATGENLHRPYFEMKKMDQNQVWRFVEERLAAYRGGSFLTRHILPSEISRSSGPDHSLRLYFDPVGPYSDHRAIPLNLQ